MISFAVARRIPVDLNGLLVEIVQNSPTTNTFRFESKCDIFGINYFIYVSMVGGFGVAPHDGLADFLVVVVGVVYLDEDVLEAAVVNLHVGDVVQLRGRHCWQRVTQLAQQWWWCDWAAAAAEQC